ncbi:MAG: glycosyltransferase [Micropruina sp.]|uniref:glycosyltransferase family 2 protein n=1 Tax=Micropruina sp. TaxID=2737536 RepID=UPI0039E646EE
MNVSMGTGPASPLRVSLVVGSMLRPEFLERFLVNVARQRTPVHQVIIVEQRDVGAVESMVARLGVTEALVVPSAPGLSRARNVGLRLVTGDIIGFPDDDCWYHPGTLSRVVNQFSSNADLGILCGRVVTSTGTMLRYPRKAGRIDRRTVWHTAVSPGLFVRATTARQIGEFDEGIGVGSGTEAGSGEETEYVLRGLEKGALAVYDPLVHVSHPSPEDVQFRQASSLGLRYGFGMGTVLRRHGYGPLSAALAVLRPSIGSVVAAASGDMSLARFRFSVARGRGHGYIGR